MQAADGREEGKPSAAPVSPRVPLCGILAAGVENVSSCCLFRQRWARVRKSRMIDGSPVEPEYKAHEGRSKRVQVKGVMLLVAA